MGQESREKRDSIMKREDWSIVIPVIATLVSAILSEVISNIIIKMIFIICIVADSIIFLSYQNNKSKWKKNLIIILSGINFLILFIVPVINSSPMIYITHLMEYFESDSKKTEIEESTININSDLTEIKDRVNEISDNVEAYSFLKSKDDPEEVIEITEKIEEVINDYSEYFPDLETSKQKVQLLYKIKLGTDEYYYCNIIRAFEAYGIDCEEMEIDEYKLLLWDIERLYAIYNMKKSIQGDLAEGVFYEEKEFLYDDFRMNMSKHSDIFDYEGWRLTYVDKTAEEVNDYLDVYITNYYKKFSLNFRENIE